MSLYSDNNSEQVLGQPSLVAYDINRILGYISLKSEELIKKTVPKTMYDVSFSFETSTCDSKIQNISTTCDTSKTDKLKNTLSLVDSRATYFELIPLLRNNEPQFDTSELTDCLDSQTLKILDIHSHIEEYPNHYLRVLKRSYYYQKHRHVDYELITINSATTEIVKIDRFYSKPIYDEDSEIYITTQVRCICEHCLLDEQKEIKKNQLIDMLRFIIRKTLMISICYKKMEYQELTELVISLYKVYLVYDSDDYSEENEVMIDHNKSEKERRKIYNNLRKESPKEFQKEIETLKKSFGSYKNIFKKVIPDSKNFFDLPEAQEIVRYLFISMDCLY